MKQKLFEFISFISLFGVLITDPALLAPLHELEKANNYIECMWVDDDSIRAYGKALDLIKVVTGTNNDHYNLLVLSQVDNPKDVLQTLLGRKQYRQIIRKAEECVSSKAQSD